MSARLDASGLVFDHAIDYRTGVMACERENERRRARTQAPLALDAALALLHTPPERSACALERLIPGYGRLK